MKKILSVFVAAAMMASMTGISLARDEAKDITVDVTTGLYTYDAEDNTVTHIDGVVEPGEDIYIGVVANDVDGVPTANDFDNYRVTATWDYGSKFVSKPEITTIKVGSDRIAVIKLDGRGDVGTKGEDVVGTIKIAGKSGALVNGEDELTLAVEFTYAWGETEGDGYIDASTPVVYFDGVGGETTLEFDGDIEFVVDVTSQDDMFIKMDTNVVHALIDAHPDANLDFINFEGTPTFNKTGTVYIPADDEGYIYSRVGNELTLIEEAWDEDEGAYVFKTRTLGDWVISDVELDLDEVDEPETSKPESKPETSKPEGGNSSVKPNPDTGDKYNPDTGR